MLKDEKLTVFQFGCIKHLKYLIGEENVIRESQKMFKGRVVPRVTSSEAERFIKKMSFKYNLGMGKFI